MTKLHILLIASTLIISVPSFSQAEPVSTLASDSAFIGSTGSNSAMPESFWPLGMALIGLAMMVRRKAA